MNNEIENENAENAENFEVEALRRVRAGQAAAIFAIGSGISAFGLGGDPDLWLGAALLFGFVAYGTKHPIIKGFASILWDWAFTLDKKKYLSILAIVAGLAAAYGIFSIQSPKMDHGFYVWSTIIMQMIGAAWLALWAFLLLKGKKTRALFRAAELLRKGE